jgi:dipeptidyl aminopeptidase/acylaminoacyl peptidase
MKSLLTFFFLLLSTLLCSDSSTAQTRRQMTPSDVLRFTSVGDAQISPDGTTVIYTISTVEGNQTRTTLFITRTMSKGAPQPFRPAEGLNASSPRWSPDGKFVAFVAAREGQSGIWVASLEDRQPRLIAPVRSANFYIAYAGESFAWSPDSRRIAFISASEENDAPDSKRERDDPRVIDRIQYKTRTGFSDPLRTHVWVTDVERPEPRQLTEGQYYDHALTWSPRNDEIAFLSNREPEPEANNNSDIFAVDLRGRTRQITDTKGCEYEPQWSPDGKLIAYTATERDVTTIDSIAEDTHVWVIDAEGGKGRELTASQDRRARSPRWASDSRALYYLAGDRGQTLIYGVHVQGGKPDALTMGRGQFSIAEPNPSQSLIRPVQISSFSMSFKATTGPIPLFAYALSDALHPSEIFLGRDVISHYRWERAVSAHNLELINSLSLVAPEEINFKSFDGTNIQGWLMKPAGFRATNRYPLILSIHGGPHGMYGWGFNATFQVYAARGYAVLYLNPRGSSGYGQKFSDGTLREWGGGDYRDLMACVDEALRRHTWIDAERMGVTGGSYGGFMTNWIITQTTRFKAAVAAASVSNLVSFYSTSLYQDLIHAEFGIFPWDDYDLLWRWSPLRYARQAQTPTLFIHGEQDNDVHITQAEEMYMALKRRGIETVLVRYPREGHGLREPRHRQDALERTLAWFDKYLK